MDTKRECAAILQELRSGKHSHVAFLVGSAVSQGGIYPCAGTSAIRDQLILGPLLHFVAESSSSGDEKLRHVILRIAEASPKLSDQDTSPRSLRDDIETMPFEVFMGCLADVCTTTATQIIDIACGTMSGCRPNLIHEIVFDLAESILTHTPCKRVTVLTTNYDECLDRCWRKRGYTGPTRTVRKRIKMYQHRFQGDRRLDYLKVHGCVTTPDSLAFTFGALADTIFDRSWFEELLRELECEDNLPSFILAIGYGFNDPDIRSALLPIVGSKDTTVHAILRPQEDPLNLPDVPSGPSLLRSDFFRFAQINQHRLDLFQINHNHLLCSLLNRLNSAEEPRPSDVIPFKSDVPEKMLLAATNLLKHLSKHDIIEFLARICHALRRGDMTEILRSELDQVSRSRSWLFTRLYLRGLSHRASYQHHLREAVRVRRLPLGSDSRAICLSEEAFVRLLAGPQPIRACWLLMRARGLKNQCDRSVRTSVDHQWLLFLSKVLQILYCRCPRWLDERGGLRFVRFWARRIENALARLEEFARKEHLQEAHVIDLVAEVGDIRSQMLLICGDISEAQKLAKEIEYIYASTGQINGLVLSARDLGWICLATGDRTGAIKRFTEAVRIATYSEDTSLLPKALGNLVRVLMGSAGNELAFQESPLPNAEELRKVAKVLFANAEANKIDQGAARRIVRAYQGSRDGTQWKEARRELLRYSDLKRYPIFLPMK